MMMNESDDMFFFDAQESSVDSYTEEPAKNEEEPKVSFLPTFPKGAELGSHFNRWSEPEAENFKIRGPYYLQDQIKVPSGPYLLTSRGADVFMTEACPEHVGRKDSHLLEGRLREVPTLIVNYRLPWGILVTYFEIPPRFLPFLFRRYNVNPAESLPSLKSMTPGDRTVCRFLLSDDDYRKERLKIVPRVAKGPWSVEQVVGSKPCIIGNYLPVTYTFQPEEGPKAAYLEVDLDIASSWSARGILSVALYATQELTLDLGFVIESKQQDELPEQMLTGTRLHGMDPFSMPQYPSDDAV